MKRCAVCNRFGFFMRLSSRNLCPKCEEKQRLADERKMAEEKAQQAYEERVANDIAIVEAQKTGGLFPGHLTSYVITDIETTGLNPSIDSIIELSALRVIDNEISETFSELISGPNLTSEIINLTGITQSELDKNGILLKEAINNYRIFIGGLPLIGHNIDGFDIRFLRNAFDTFHFSLFNETIDTLSLAKKYLDCSNYKLSSLKDCLCLEGGVSHRALNDCQTTLSLYRYLGGIIPAKQPVSKKDLFPNNTDKMIVSTLKNLINRNQKYLRFKKMPSGYLRIKGFYNIADIKTENKKLKDYVVFRAFGNPVINNIGNLQTAPDRKGQPQLRYYFDSQEEFLTIAQDIVRIYLERTDYVEETIKICEAESNFRYTQDVNRYLDDPEYFD